MDNRFTGVIPPVVTPFTAAGEVDFDSLDKVVEHLIAGGVNGLFALGSSGEVAYLTDAQRDAVIERVVKAAAGRVPVLAGAIDTTAHRVIDQARRAAALGAEAIGATCPFYALNDAEEIKAHFRAIAAAIDVPVFAYDVPVRLGGAKLGCELLVELGKEGVLVGVKDSSGDDVSFRWLCRANEAAGHPLQLLTGHEVVVDGAYMSGADGSVPGLANVDPEGYVRQWQAYERRDWEAVRTEQDRLADLMRIVQVKGVQGFGAGVGAFKAALHLLGVFDSPEMPRPVAAIEGDNMEHVASVLRAVGLLS